MEKHKTTKVYKNYQEALKEWKRTWRPSHDLGGHLVDTADAHDKGKLGISGNIVVSLLASLTPQPDLVPLLILVFLGELLSTLEDVGTLGFANNLGLNSLLGPEGAVLCLPLPPLQDGLRHCRQFTFHSHCGFSCRSESSNK